MRYPYYTLDVFTDQMFGGNPLAVFPQAEGLSAEVMQRIAAEINYSETVFVLPPTLPNAQHRLRIFTPTTELPFAGHPTLGAAFLLAYLNPPALWPTQWHLEEPVGLIPVTLHGQGSVTHTALTIADPPETRPSPLDSPAVAQLLGLTNGCIEERVQAYSCGLPFLFVPLRNQETLAAIQFNFSHWQRDLADQWAHCVYCVAPADPSIPLEQNALLYGRMFAPGLGITEDPATGSAVAALGGFLGDRLKHLKNSASPHQWTIHQGLEMGRPSQLTLTITLDPSTITVAGQSVIVSEGHWLL